MWTMILYFLCTVKFYSEILTELKDNWLVNLVAIIIKGKKTSIYLFLTHVHI